METRFIADDNVGKLARSLRLMGYDTILLKQKDDARMIRAALVENRVILTKDAQFMRRRLVMDGRIKAMHVKSDNPERQVQEVVERAKLDYHFKPFSLCLECNRALIARDQEDVKNLVPPRVFQTQTQYKECPACHRIYWPGTHWQAMVRKLRGLEASGGENGASG